MLKHISNFMNVMTPQQAVREFCGSTGLNAIWILGRLGRDIEQFDALGYLWALDRETETEKRLAVVGKFMDRFESIISNRQRPFLNVCVDSDTKSNTI